jgi:hypothetical protein
MIKGLRQQWRTGRKRDISKKVLGTGYWVPGLFTQDPGPRTQNPGPSTQDPGPRNITTKFETY